MRSLFGKSLESAYREMIYNLAMLFASHHFKPLTFTVLGLAFSFVAMVLLCYRYLLSSAIFVLLAGLCDSVDGAIARINSQSTNYGALLDSTFDRIGEIFIFFGLFYYFRFSHTFAAQFFEWLTFFALGASLMISYIRARIEGLGGTCRVGLIQRPERIVIIALALILSELIRPHFQSIYLVDIPLKLAILFIGVGGVYTVAERLDFARKEFDLKKKQTK